MEDRLWQAADVLPNEYKRFNDQILKDLLKNFSNIGADMEGDVFGQIHEYFLSKFAMSPTGQDSGPVGTLHATSIRTAEIIKLKF